MDIHTPQADAWRARDAMDGITASTTDTDSAPPADNGEHQEPDDATHSSPLESGVSALAGELVRVRAEMARMSAENHRLRREVADTIIRAHREHDKQVAATLRKLGDMIVNLDKRLAVFEQQRERKGNVSAWH